MMQLEEQGDDGFLASGSEVPVGRAVRRPDRGAGAARRRGAPSRTASTCTRCTPTSSGRATPTSRSASRSPGRATGARSAPATSSPARRSGVILTMSLSFQVDEAGHDVQIARMPDVPAPEELVGHLLEPGVRASLRACRGPRRRAAAWRGSGCATPVGDDPVLQACALAYLSDDIPTDAVVAVHPDRPSPEEAELDHGWMSASLDHAIWFHRPSRGRRVARPRLHRPRLPVEPRPRRRPHPQPRRRPHRDRRPRGPAADTDRR